MPELLTKKQAAELLGIGVSTLDSWVRQGKLAKHTANGYHVRFKRRDLERFVEKLPKKRPGKAPSLGREAVTP